MFYPLFINLKNKKILVIGGGRVGSRRALYLLKAGALVAVISKEFDKKLEIKNKNLKIIKKDITKIKINVSGYFLVVIATNDKKINDKIINKIKKNKTLVCRADKPSDGDVIFPAVSSVKEVKIAYTSFGKNPRLIKRIKGIIENEA